MTTPVSAATALARPYLAWGTDSFGVARRGAAAALVVAVLLGSGGVALAASTLAADAWTVALVVLTALLAGALLAANAWRKSFC